MSDEHAYTWIPVAFVRQTGGRLHVLFGVDRGATPLFDGEPVLLVDHHPDHPHTDVSFEPAEIVGAEIVSVLDAHRADFAACIAAAFGRDGGFDADRLLAQRVLTSGRT